MYDSMVMENLWSWVAGAPEECGVIYYPVEDMDDIVFNEDGDEDDDDYDKTSIVSQPRFIKG